MTTSDIRSRAQGCLLGQLAGDALGSLVEFQSPTEIRRKYPDGVRVLKDGGTWNTLAGQPTDDSEMALLLARMLVKRGEYSAEAAHAYYSYWLESGTFDCGSTINAALLGGCTINSQANGALMRVSPLGIFGAHHNTDTLVRWAMADAKLTHPNPICTQVNALFCLAIADAVWSRTNPDALYQSILFWAKDLKVAPEIRTVIDRAAVCPPEDYILHQGWVLTAFQNALWQLLHARDLEEALVDTIGRGGDTDTNAAICGALLGAVYGRSAIPERWQKCILNCRPQVGVPGVAHPRPRCFWPVDALELADQLIGYEQEVYPDPAAEWANAVL